jgi:putative tricarboxylic transport membrane protein
MGIGSLIGTGIGILPGLGQTVSCWLAYGFAKKRSKNPEMFGKGSLEGVAAAESGNNAVKGPAILPMLALGIPGDTVTAILLGAFIAQGMRPGPLLFEQQGVMVYAILLIMLIGNVLFLIIGKAFIPLFSKVTALSNGVLVPIVCALSMIGAYAVNNSVFDVGVMVIFGLVGYLMKIAGLPVAPMVIALLLGDMMETAFSQTIIMGRGTLKLLYQRPISVIFLSITLLIVLKIIYDRIKNKNKKAKIAHEGIL